MDRCVHGQQSFIEVAPTRNNYTGACQFASVICQGKNLEKVQVSLLWYPIIDIQVTSQDWWAMPQTPAPKGAGHIFRNFLDNRGLPVGLRVLNSPIVAFDNGQAWTHQEALQFLLFLLTGRRGALKNWISLYFLPHDSRCRPPHRKPIAHTACLLIATLCITKNSQRSAISLC